MVAFFTVQRLPRLVLLTTACIAAAYFLADKFIPHSDNSARLRWPWEPERPPFDWAKRPMKHPLENGEIAYPPDGPPLSLPRIQHSFSQDPPLSPERVQELGSRQRAVRNTFQDCWESYKMYAWGYDELRPESLAAVNTFAGWAATIVDSLDVLWIMGLEAEFREAAAFVATIDWDRSTSKSCSLFETNIRYLGGLLAAYDLSGEQKLLNKALELGHLLFSAFDTENHLPVNNLNFRTARGNSGFIPSTHESSANLGTLSMEFTRLTQLSGDPKFFSVIDRLKREFDNSQDATKLPGMWPRYINVRHGFVTEDKWFTLNAPSDSLYEYLAKTHIIIGGRDPAYERMYRKAMEAIRTHVLFRPIVPGDPDILMPGVVSVDGGKVTLSPEVQHLGCFAGGMFALGARLFQIDEYIGVGDRLARGCAWAYNATATGIMPEQFQMLPCRGTRAEDASTACRWESVRGDWEPGWNKYSGLPGGFTSIWDRRYLLRPEAIESVFYLYRITGSRDLQEIAWEMFQAVREATKTAVAYSIIADVTTTGRPHTLDSMESFWMAETLKYYYLIFSAPDRISLDDYVLNTEAHPFRIPKP